MAIDDVNDHVPETEDPSYRVHVPEDTPPRTPLLTLRATDGDANSSVVVSFFVSSIRGRRNTLLAPLTPLGGANLEEQGWDTIANGEEIFHIDRSTGE